MRFQNVTTVTGQPASKSHAAARRFRDQKPQQMAAAQENPDEYL